MTTNLNQNINEIKLGKTNYILYQYDSSMPFLFFLKINNINEIMNNIYINIRLEGLDVYRDYDWYLTGYFLNTDKTKEIINILDTKPASIGYYDNILNIGIISFNSNQMVKYYNSTNNLVLLIKLIDTKNEETKNIDIMAKVTPTPDKISINNIDSFSIPPFEYYFSYFNDNYMSYNLSLFNNIYNYMSLELIFSSNKINFILCSEKFDILDKNKINLFNETNKIKKVDERYKDGKRSLILLLEKGIKNIYLLIFNKEENIINNKIIFFGFKYYYFSKEEYDKGKYLYKNRFIMKNNEISFNKRKGGVNYINWNPIILLQTKENKGKINIDYYLKIFKEEKIEKTKFFNNNIKLSENLDNKSLREGKHLINKNEYELIDDHLLENENITINLIAKFNELNGMENFIIYKTFVLFDRKNNKEESNDIYDNDDSIKDKYKIIPSKQEKNKIFYFIFKIIIILIIVLTLVFIILFCYKKIRRYQINKIVNNLIIHKNEKPENNYELITNRNKSNNKEGTNYNSKISYMIENL